MKIIKYTIIAALSIIPLILTADYAKVTDDLAIEYAQGAAYALIIHQGFESSGGSAEVSKRYSDMHKALSLVSVMLSWESRSIEMGNKVTLSRIEWFKSDMLKEMGNNYRNISILSSKYEKAAFSLLDSTDQVIEALDSTNLTR